MSLKTRITDDMKAAMRARDTRRLGAVRLITAAIKQKEVDERVEADDTAVIAILEKMAKQRRDSISQFTAAGRTDLADQEQFELDLLQDYLPQALGTAEISAVVEAAISELNAQGMKDMSRVMAKVRPALIGRADMAAVSAIIKGRLTA